MKLATGRQRKRSAAQGRGVLFTLAAMFLLSGALRVIDGTATAASGMSGHGAAEIHAPELATGPVEPPLDAAGISAAMAELRAREERVAASELAIADRMRALEVAEATVDKKLAELKSAEERLQATMAQSQSAAENDIARLTTVYENMKPKEATQLFARMAPEFAAGFLGRMRPDAAALILSGLDPDQAYSISVLLASRNANAPTE